MTDEHYDSMYQTSCGSKTRITCQGYPTTRWEFALKHARGGTVVLDIGCGGGGRPSRDRGRLPFLDLVQ